MELFITNTGLQHIGVAIFKYLDHKTLVMCRLVNRSWKKMVDDPRFWLKKCDQTGIKCRSPGVLKELDDEEEIQSCNEEFKLLMDDLQKNYGKLIQNLDRIQPLWSTSLKKELGTI